MAKSSRRKTSQPPGTVIFTGSRKVEKIIIHYLEYDSEVFTEQIIDNQTITEFHSPQNDLIQWYDIRGLHDTELIEAFGTVFKLNRLILEDIVDPFQRPKFNLFDNGFLIMAKALSFHKETRQIKTEQVAIYCGKDFLLSFQENESDLFLAIKERVKNKLGFIRQKGADYLAYAILDALIDNYFLVLDEVDEDLVLLEDEVLAGSQNDTKEKIYNIRREVQRLRKTLNPMRELVNQFSKANSEIIENSIQPFLRDLYEHLIQASDLAEFYREELFNLHDLHLSEINTKMNNVMRVLTIISTIFIPLTFLAGIYGMNFENMPELRWRYAYFGLWIIMIAIFVSLVLFFRRKKWL